MLRRIKPKLGAIKVLNKSKPNKNENWEFCSVWLNWRKSLVFEIEYILTVKAKIT